MHIADFDYALPPERIAKRPARPRDASHMMVIERRTGQWLDSHFRELPEFLDPSDVLVLNNTRVVRARTKGVLERTGRPVEILFAPPGFRSPCEALLRPARRIRPGDRLLFRNADLVVTVEGRREHGIHILSVSDEGKLEALFASNGRVPLPPYLGREDTPEDVGDYQTIYAHSPGAVAAPTAGLHFTEGTLSALLERGVEIHQITLHVGLASFLPVRSEDPEKHRLEPERYRIDTRTALALNRARQAGRRIVAVGTTTARALEHVIARYGKFRAGFGEADLFILPGYRFQAAGALLTNFHLPRSTLLMLVCSFASRSTILDAYQHAVESRYRFYSYGDCMLLR